MNDMTADDAKARVKAYLDRVKAEVRAKSIREAAQVLADEIDLARIAMPQSVPILAADRRAILALLDKEGG